MVRKMVFEDSGRSYVRVSKARARKLYDMGAEIVLCPSNLRPLGMWHPECRVQKADILVDEDFDGVVRAFEFYNCSNAETGRNTNFFVEAET